MSHRTEADKGRMLKKHEGLFRNPRKNINFACVKESHTMAANGNKAIAYNNIDFIRMIMMVIVILCHIVPFTRQYPLLKEGFLTFIMPCFLLVTASLVNVNKTPREFLLYILRIFLPYATMVLGYAAVSLFLPVSDGLKAFTLSEILRVVFVDSIGPYWFLHVLLLCGAVYYLVYRVFGRCSAITKYFLLVSVLVFLSLYTPVLSLRNALYYSLGVAVRQSGMRMQHITAGTPLAALPFAMLMYDHSRWDWMQLTIALSAVFFFFFCNWLYSLQRKDGRMCRHLCFLGRNTLALYLFHPIFTMACKFVHPFFCFDASGILFAFLDVLCSVYGSLAIGWIIDRTRLCRLWLTDGVLR